VVAYQIKVGFEAEVVQAVDALSEGTMTEMWGDPFFYSYEGVLGVGGMTTNQPSKRLIPDGGILCYLSLLVQGTPTEPSTASTLLPFFDAVIFTLDERMPVAHTKTGLVTVQENPSVVDVQIPLYPGENMVCLSVVPETPTLPDILHSHPVSYVFGFQSDQTPPKSWVKDRPINDLESLDGIHGYWMKLDSSDAVTWEVTGTPVSVSTPVPVYRGWNLIGYFPSLSDSIAHAFQTISPYYNYILGYQGGEGPRSWVRERPDFLNDLFLLFPRSGYWVRMDSAATLVYPSGGYPASKSPADFPDTIEQDESSEVYITPWWCDFWAIQPEWLSPGDRIEVYDSDSVLCGETWVKEESGFLVHVFGDDPSTAAIDEGAEAGETMRFVVNGMETEVVDGDPAWTDRGSKCVQLEPVSSGIPLDSKSHLPKCVLLNQNYPNPFNSRTVIPYTLSLPSKVDIRIYDVSGRWIMNRSRPAGLKSSGTGKMTGTEWSPAVSIFVSFGSITSNTCAS
jgi:hypothetical protein